MATILGAVFCSHTPTIGFAFDHEKQNDPVWKPIFEAFTVLQNWLEAKKPDVLLWVYNDHITSFFFDHYSAFALGIDTQYSPADEGGGVRQFPSVAGHHQLAQHIGHSLFADDFDLSFFQGKPLDHGFFSPFSMLRAGAYQSPVSLIPLQVGVLQFPIPSARRCFHLGKAIRKAIECYPDDLKVVLVASGGLSHQVHGERAGFNNTDWDMEFLDRIEKDPESLTKLTHADYARLGGVEGAEVIMWLIARGALSGSVKKIDQTYYLPSMTAISTAIYEDLGVPATEEQKAEQLALIHHQLAGADQLTGTYPFDLTRSVKGFRINSFLHRLVDSEARQQFLDAPESAFEAAGLSNLEREMIRNRDWRAMIHYGATFFVLEKLGAVVGVSNLHIYAAMRGQSLEEFMKTRNAPSALYSVAATSSHEPDWVKT